MDRRRSLLRSCERSSCGWAGDRSPISSVAMVHEVTHIVFNDATDNPFHEPATLAQRGHRDMVGVAATRASSGGSSSSRPVAAGSSPSRPSPSSSRSASARRQLSLCAGHDHGRQHHRPSTAGRPSPRITAAYRDGASDAEALEAGTGVPADAAVRRLLRGVRRGRARRRSSREPIARVQRRPPTGRRDRRGRRDRGARGAAGRRAPGESPPDGGGEPCRCSCSSRWPRSSPSVAPSGSPAAPSGDRG